MQKQKQLGWWGRRKAQRGAAKRGNAAVIDAVNKPAVTGVRNSISGGAQVISGSVVEPRRGSAQGPKKGFLHFYTPKYSNKLSYDDLLAAESELGRTLFGPVPEGHQREFFEHRKNVWIWYENYVDAAGVLREMTIRYEVRPTGVYKRPMGGKYRRLEGRELENFRQAARMYLGLVKERLYS